MFFRIYFIQGGVSHLAVLDQLSTGVQAQLLQSVRVGIHRGLGKKLWFSITHNFKPRPIHGAFAPRARPRGRGPARDACRAPSSVRAHLMVFFSGVLAGGS